MMDIEKFQRTASNTAIGLLKWAVFGNIYEPRAMEWLTQVALKPFSFHSKQLFKDIAKC
jgi:hypothetical protein